MIGGGGGVSLPWVDVHSVICENLLCVMVLPRSMLTWRRGGGQSAIGICALCYMLNLLGVMVVA